jgi:hypothetical protein
MWQPPRQAWLLVASQQESPWQFRKYPVTAWALSQLGWPGLAWPPRACRAHANCTVPHGRAGDWLRPEGGWVGGDCVGPPAVSVSRQRFRYGAGAHLTVLYIVHPTLLAHRFIGSVLPSSPSRSRRRSFNVANDLHDGLVVASILY